jgi:hypothetical protein
MRSIFARAERFDVERGGRFDRRSAAVLIWSTNAAAAESGEPVGAFFVRRSDPTEEQATIYRIEWDPVEGGTRTRCSAQSPCCGVSQPSRARTTGG